MLQFFKRVNEADINSVMSSERAKRGAVLNAAFCDSRDEKIFLRARKSYH